MRLVFAGTPAFAATALRALNADSRHRVVGVLTQPDRPAGRGLQPQPSAVKQLAMAQGLPVWQPPGLKLDGRFGDAARDARARLVAAAPDVIVVAAYGLILPQWLLALPRHGCLNIHASLLPRWRGAAPIQRAIEAGDRETGITIMQMDAGLDTGAMLLRRQLPIADDDTAAALHDRLAVLGAQSIVDALVGFEGGVLKATPQPEEGITYAHKIEKGEGVIDWRDTAVAIERRIRAFDPFPGAHLRRGDAAIKVWRARVVANPDGAAPGTVLSAPPQPLVVACGHGALELTLLQRPGGRRVAAAQGFGAAGAPRRGEQLPLPGGGVVRAGCAAD